MSFCLSHIDTSSTFVAVDLGLYRVRAGIYNGLEIQGFASVRQGRNNWIDGMISNIAGISQRIEQAIIQATPPAANMVDDIIMSFPSRSFVSDTITTQYIRVDPVVTLTMQEIDTMIRKIESESSQRARIKSQKQFGSISDDLRLISSTIVAISIDGRRVMSPVGFAGSRVRLTVLNIFVPSSEFNMMRSVISHTGKRPLSLIPAPLILPKLLEESVDIDGSKCLIDIGYGHLTISIIADHQMVGFETFSYGSDMLISLITDAHPLLSSLEIENIICSSETLRSDIYRPYLDDFIAYITDTLFAYLESEHIDLKIQNLILHGTIFVNTSIESTLVSQIVSTLGYEIRSDRLHTLIDPVLPHDGCVVRGLSLMAHEILLARRDPLVRILRYILYQYA